MGKIDYMIFKQNAKTFLVNAVVDVRLRRCHEMIFLNISETVRGLQNLQQGSPR